MLLQILRPLEGFTAELTAMRLQRYMNSDVRGYVISLDGGGPTSPPRTRQAQIVRALSAHMDIAEMVLQSHLVSVKLHQVAKSWYGQAERPSHYNPRKQHVFFFPLLFLFTFLQKKNQHTHTRHTLRRSRTDARKLFKSDDVAARPQTRHTRKKRRDKTIKKQRERGGCLHIDPLLSRTSRYSHSTGTEADYRDPSPARQEPKSAAPAVAAAAAAAVAEPGGPRHSAAGALVAAEAAAAVAAVVGPAAAAAVAEAAPFSRLDDATAIQRWGRCSR